MDNIFIQLTLQLVDSGFKFCSYYNCVTDDHFIIFCNDYDEVKEVYKGLLSDGNIVKIGITGNLVYIYPYLPMKTNNARCLLFNELKG